MKLFFALLFAASFFASAKTWPCKSFKMPTDEFFEYGACAYSIQRRFDEKLKKQLWLYISVPLRSDKSKTALLKLRLLDNGNSYTDEQGRGHWAHKINDGKLTLIGSIGSAGGLTVHSFLRNGVLISAE